MPADNARREFIKTASAAFTTSIFTGRIKGANDKPAIAHIGMGRMNAAEILPWHDRLCVSHVAP